MSSPKSAPGKNQPGYFTQRQVWSELTGFPWKDWEVFVHCSDVCSGAAASGMVGHWSTVCQHSWGQQCPAALCSYNQ